MKTNSVSANNKAKCIATYLQLIVLPFLVYLYFVLGYFHIVSLPVQAHSIALMGIIFISSLIFAQHNAFFGRCLFKKNFDTFNANLKAHIVNNIVQIAKVKKSNASFDDFVAQENKDIRNNNYASIAASVFPTMGILGTFISIALTMPDFAASSNSELDKEISILLSGVGTAFYVSIYGILLSLWWIFFEKLGLSLYDKDINSIKENTKELFWTKEELEQAYLRENLNHFSEISSMLKSLSQEKFFIKLSQAIDEKFDLFDKMLKLESEVVNLSSKQVKEGLKDLRIAQDKQQNLGKVHTDILRTLQQFSKGLDEMQLNSVESYAHIKEGQKEINTSMIELRKSLRENVNNISSLYDTLPKDLKNTQESILKTFNETLNESLTKFWHEGLIASQSRHESLQSLKMDELKEELKGIDEQSEELIKHVEELKSQQ